jgi:hypothetical protein
LEGGETAEEELVVGAVEGVGGEGADEDAGLGPEGVDQRVELDGEGSQQEVEAETAPDQVRDVGEVETEA